MLFHYLNLLRYMGSIPRMGSYIPLRSSHTRPEPFARAQGKPPMFAKLIYLSGTMASVGLASVGFVANDGIRLKYGRSHWQACLVKYVCSVYNEFNLW